MRNTIFLIIGLFITVTIILFAIFIGLGKKEPGSDVNSPSPTKVPPQIDITPPYEREASRNLLKRIVERPTPQVNTDITIREELIAGLGGNTGTLLEVDGVKLEYIKSPNLFQGEISSSDIESAKQKAVDFLKKKGLTEDGICKLPIFFTLSPSVMKNVRETGSTYSPAPSFCK